MAKVMTLSGLPTLRGLGALSDTTSGKILKYGILAGLGAGAGYVLLKNKMSSPGAAILGGAAALGMVLAFQPGGWLRTA